MLIYVTAIKTVHMHFFHGVVANILKEATVSGNFRLLWFMLQSPRHVRVLQNSNKFQTRFSLIMFFP